ncbi:hypothetical protein, partial [Nocardioides sp.]|uniref:hypothetical protein n=1 Tax=Nocardioides sp. TaxID=35761 RepID=UPI0027362604
MSGTHSHSHSHAAPPDVEVGRLPRLALVSGIVLAAVATVIGVVVLWPSADARVPPVPYAAEGAETVS